MNDEINVNNIVLATDSYKLTHHKQDLPGTENTHSYYESRKGAKYPYTVWFGLQSILLKYLVGKVLTKEDIDYAEMLAGIHFGDNGIFERSRWDYILEKYDGKLPIEICAVEEGSVVPTGNVLMTVQSTDENVPWLTNALESILTHVWYPSTVATASRELKVVIKECLEKSSDHPELALPFAVHDFGYRGVSSHESAGIGGMGHLVNFKGTDTLPAIIAAAKYYDADIKTLAFSVPASEHSIATAAGETGEYDYLLRMIRAYPNGIVSVVADSYKITRFCEKYMADAKEEILERWKNGKGILNRIVVRPDSPRWEGDTPHAQVAWIMETLWNIYGGTINSKGYRVLHPAVGVIYGDGLSSEDIGKIFRYVTNHANFPNAQAFDCSLDVTGQGGGLLQKINRDTQRFAFKCSAKKRNGIWHDVQKNPLDQTKASKAGRLALIRDENGVYSTIKESELNGRENMLKPVFRNGELLRPITFDQIRQNAEVK